MSVCQNCGLVYLEAVLDCCGRMLERLGMKILVHGGRLWSVDKCDCRCERCWLVKIWNFDNSVCEIF